MSAEVLERIYSKLDKLTDDEIFQLFQLLWDGLSEDQKNEFWDNERDYTQD